MRTFKTKSGLAMLLFAAALTGCASQDLDNSTSVSAINTNDAKTQPKDEAQSLAKLDEEAADRQTTKASFCPELKILEGTSVLTAYLSGGKDTNADVSHQATIIKSGRKCTLADGKLMIRVGAAGRVRKGPKAVGDAVELPIRIAVLKGENKVLFSKLYQQSVSLVSTSAQQFSFVQTDVSIPMPKSEDVKILVGFDTKTSS